MKSSEKSSEENRFSFLRAIPTLTVGLGTGALLTFLSDPVQGRHRRALVRDKLIHYNKVARRKAVAQAFHVRNRLVGLAARGRSAFSRKPLSDEILIARVASKLGRIVANPHSIGITADDGTIFLSGLIFQDEVSRLLAQVRRIKGVKGVENKLEPHARHEHVSGLQGEAA